MLDITIHSTFFPHNDPDAPDVRFGAGQIEPGDADGDREGGPAQQMETR